MAFSPFRLAGQTPAALSVQTVGGYGGQVVGEVGGGAGVIGAVHRGDLEVRKLDARVQGRDGGVVPVGDLAAEDLGDGGGVELQVRDARDVEGDGDRGNVDRDVNGAVGAALVLGAGELVILEVGIGAGELGRAVEDRLASGAGTVRGVLHSCALVRGSEVGLPDIHGCALGGRTDAGQGAGDRGTRGGRRRGLGRVGCVVRTAGGQRECADGDNSDSRVAAEAECLH